MNLLLNTRLLRLCVSNFESNFMKSACITIANIKHYSNKKPDIILGIETSCDDTGCGIVDSTGKILGEAISSQQVINSRYGGIIPGITGNIHISKITDVCEEALRSANLRLRDIDAIATTIKPGMLISLNAGLDFGKYLSLLGNKPFIPIHHMEAHALTVRLTEKVDFPYLVLLISGGNCLLALVEDVNKFYLLGTSLCNTPGEVLDKIARRLKLSNNLEYHGMSGGEAIELAARKATNPDQFPFPPMLTLQANCQFSFSAIFSIAFRHIETEEKKHDTAPDAMIPDVHNLCAAVQLIMAQHLCHRTQRAMEFIELMKLIPKDKKTFVISGGVASNNFIAKALNIVCSELNYKFVRTPPRYCTDNGVMIAWNGVEKWLKNIDIVTNTEDIKNIQAEHKALLGEDWIKKVDEAQIKCKWVKIKQKLF